MKINLSASQEEVVNFEDGCLLVQAGPGSGKTRVIIERVKRLLNKNERFKILALTFSNLAADEMKKRISEDENDINSNNFLISTIHSFCLTLIQDRYKLLGLEKEPVIFDDSLGKKKMLLDIIRNNDNWRQYYNDDEKKDKFLNDLLLQISEYKRNFIMPNQIENQDYKDIYQAYNDYLISQNAMDFDDIIYYAYRILIDNPRVLELYNKIYKYYMVDEAQDLNFSEYMLIKVLCQNTGNLMMVGDSNQSIYGFNGSSSDYMTKNFVEDFNPTLKVLNENFRSAKNIINFANKLKNKEDKNNYYYDGEINFNSFKDFECESKYIVDRITTLKLFGHKDIDHELKDNDFCIIARNRFVLDNVEKKLKNNHIPYYLKKTKESLDFDSKCIKIFDLCLKMVINDKDIIHFNEIKNILNIEGSEWKEVISKSKYNKFLELFNKIENNFNFSSILRKLKEIIYEFQLEDQEKEMILNDIKLYEKHWNKYTKIVSSENRSLSSFRSYIALGKTYDNSNDKGVALLTAHMAKGLQYEVVFIIGMCDGLFPDYRAIKNTNELEQEKNNFFVAVTRAKRICEISYERQRMMPWDEMVNQRPSRFIKDEKIIFNK